MINFCARKDNRDWVPTELPGAGCIAFAVLINFKVESSAFTTLGAPFTFVRLWKVSRRPGSLVIQFSDGLGVVQGVHDKR